MSVSDHPELFFTDLVENPQAVVTRAAQIGIRLPAVAELGAWTWELGAQVDHVAKELGIPLLLMAGTAAQMRFKVQTQRGSQDADFIVQATKSQIADIARVLEQRLRATEEPAPYLLPELYPPGAGAKRVAMVRYDIIVPSLLNLTREHVVKLEFHIWDRLPPNEIITGQVFPFASKVTQRIPRIPYQIGLKLATIAAPPLGVPAHREGEIPKQLSDLDQLFVVMKPREWAQIGPGLQLAADHETSRSSLADTWAGIRVRLNDWALNVSRQSGPIRNYELQVAVAQRLSPVGWRTRARRLQFAAQCAEQGDAETWEQAMAQAQTLRASNQRSALEQRWTEERGSPPDQTLRSLNAEGLWWEFLATGGSSTPTA